MKRLLLAMMAVVGALTMSAQSAQNVYAFKVADGGGDTISLADYRGKVLLVVNTATRCGFTPQYTELQELYASYRNKGFEVLDFPCNQFGNQAPGTNEEIREFCTANFNVEFPQLDKIEVNGENAAPLYVYLKSQCGFAGFDLNDGLGKRLDDMFRQRDPNYDQNPDIKWNFTKFLISRDGRVLRRFEPSEKMSVVAEAVKEALTAKSE